MHRRRINTGEGRQTVPENLVFGINIFCAERNQSKVVLALAKVYPMDDSIRGVDNKDMCFVPNLKYYANFGSVARFKELREKQRNFERSVIVTKLEDIEVLDKPLDEDGTTLRQLIHNILAPSQSKEKWLYYNVDIIYGEVYVACVAQHGPATSTVQASLLKYLDQICSPYYKAGPIREKFRKKLYSCFSDEAKDFARTCEWNEVRQQMETPQDKLLMLTANLPTKFAVIENLQFVKDAPQTKAIRKRKKADDDTSSLSTQPTIGIDMSHIGGMARTESNLPITPGTAAAASQRNNPPARSGQMPYSFATPSAEPPPSISVTRENPKKKTKANQPIAPPSDAPSITELAAAVAKILIEDVDKKRGQAISDSNREADQQMAIAIEANNKTNAETMAATMAATVAATVAATLTSELAKFFPNGNPAQTDSASNDFPSTAKAGGLSGAPGATK